MVTTYACAIVMAIVYPLAWGAASTGGNHNRKIDGTDNTAAKIMVLLIFLTFVIFAGFRTISGATNDEYVYRNRVLKMVGKSLMSQLKASYEIFDTIPNWIVANTIGDSQGILVWNAVLTYGCFIYCIYRQCDNFELGILLLFLLNIVNVSFNTMQQISAVSVTMFSIPYIYKRKFKKFAAIIIIATLIHTTAIMLIALYFIANMKPWSGKFIAVAAGFVIVMTVFRTVAPGLFRSLGMFDEYGSTYDSGVRGITVIVAFVPLVFALVFKGYMPKDDSEMNCAINMCMIYAMIYLVSTQNVYVARFAMYIQPYLIIFFTRLITILRKDHLSTIAYYVLILGYGATFIYFTSSTSYKFVGIF